MNPQQLQNLMNNMNNIPNNMKYTDQAGQVINVTSDQQQAFKQIQTSGGQNFQSGFQHQQIQGMQGLPSNIQGLIQQQMQGINQTSNGMQANAQTRVESHHSFNKQVISGSEVKVTKEEHNSSHTEISNNRNKNSSSASVNILDIENVTDLFCEAHKQDKEYIILEDLGEFRKLTPVCNICAAELQRQFKRKPNMESYMTIIYANAHAILNIKNKQVNIENFGQGSQCRAMFVESIQVLVDEMVSVCQEFSTSFIQVVDTSNSSLSYSNSQIKKIQVFIDSITLKSDGSPELQDIGSAEKHDLKIKYIKLAGFLLRFEGFGALMETVQSSSFTGVTAVFKSHITRIIEIRKRLVVAITEWLKFLLGPFYEFAFGLEKVSVDSTFRSTHLSFVEFVTENVNINTINISMHKEYILLLERIRILERENQELRIKAEESTVVVSSENVDALKERIIYLESIIDRHQTEIINITNINKTEITNIINKQKTEFINISKTFELKISELNIQISTYLGQIESFKKQFEIVTRERDEWKVKFEQSGNSLNVKNETHINQINEYNIKIQTIYGELSSWKSKYEQVKREYDEFNFRFTKIEEERNLFRSEAESLKIQITNVNITINSYVNEINNLKKEREALMLKMEQIRIESTTRIENHVSQYTLIIKEKEDRMRQWESEASEWKLRYDQVSIQISHYEERINQLNITINKHIENITIINGQIGEWEKKYRLVVVERDGYVGEMDKLRVEIHNNTKIIQTHTEKNTVIISEREGRIKCLEEELAQWRFRYEQLNVRISEFEQHISELNVIIRKHSETTTIINSEAGDWKSQYEIIKVERDNYYAEIERLRREVMNSTKVTETHTEKHTVIIREKEEAANQYKKEAYDWKVKFENLQKQIEIYQSQISDLQITINKHNESVTVITTESGDWKTKFEMLYAERETYIREIERLRSEVFSSSKISQTHVEKHTLIIRERDDRINGLVQEAEGWKLKWETLNKRIEEYEKRISQLQIEIRTYEEKIEVVSRDDWESKYWGENSKVEILSQEIERLRAEIVKSSSHVERHVEKHVVIIKEKETIINGLQGDLMGLRMELNSKISIISRLEMTIKALEERISQMTVTVETLTKEVTFVKSDKTTEIQRHILLINTCKEEFFKLSESYESLLIDIKQQISINEALRKLVIELMNKIEEHNHTIGSLDMQIKQQIELLTRQTLSKKYIDALPSIELVTKSEKDLLVLRNKVGRMETEKLHKSQVFESSSQSVIEIFEKKEIFSGDRSVFSNVQENVNVNVISGGAASGVIGGVIAGGVVSGSTTTNFSSHTNVTNISAGNVNSNFSAARMIANNFVSGGASKAEVSSSSEKHEFVQVQSGSQSSAQQGGAFNYLADLDNLKNIQANLNNMHRNINVSSSSSNVQVVEQRSSSTQETVNRAVNEAQYAGKSQKEIFDSLSKQVINESVYLNPSDC